MQKVLTAAEMREVDRLTTERYGIPSILLMENAAHAAARVIAERLGGSVKGKSFLILCGKGNNGGDGAALARILWTLGADVSIILVGKIEDTKDNAKLNFEILKNLEFDTVDIWQCETSEEIFGLVDKYFPRLQPDVLIDALFGTGLTKPLSELHQRLVWFVAGYDAKKTKTLTVALDIPSGLDANISNQIGQNSRTHLTVTFTAPKLANVLPPASNFNGELHVANIGSPPELIDASPSKIFLAEKSDAQSWLEKTEYTSDSYKNKRGHALLIVGSKEYMGAAILAANAAMVSGVGLTTVATSESAQTAIQSKVLEEIITRCLAENKAGAIAEKAFAEVEAMLEKIDAVGIGCGLGAAQKQTKNFVREVVERRKTPIVIDADALNALSPFDLKGSNELPLILTPHEGEFLRLLGTNDKEILKDRVQAARDFAEKHKVILVLKGERVLIAAPDGTVVINPTGNSGLGKAGNGDTLTGVITGFVAQAAQMKIDVFETVVAAVYISSLAGDIAAERFGKRTMLASDVRDCLGAAFGELEKEKL